MANHNKLKNHLKNFTVKDLKKEVINVKKGFQVSKLRRVDVENVILKNHLLFQHLLKTNKVKKTKPSIKKPNSTVKDINKNKEQQINMSVKLYINQLLDKLDEKAAGKRYPEFINEPHRAVTIQKGKSQYIIRGTKNFNNIILRATTDRKQVEDILYHLLT